MGWIGLHLLTQIIDQSCGGSGTSPGNTGCEGGIDPV